jgi:hypothetical protein
MFFCPYCPVYRADPIPVKVVLPTVCKVQNFIIDSEWEQTRDKRKTKKEQVLGPISFDAILAA